MKPLTIFDLDGTLYAFDKSDTTNFTSSRFYEKVKENSYKFIQKKLNMNLEKAAELYDSLIKNFNGEVSLGLEKKYKIDRYEWFEKTWDINPKDFIERVNMKPIINSLEAEIFILTAAPRIWASKVLDYLGLSEYQDRLFTGEPDLRKPNPEAFKQICDICNVPPEKSFSIGDQIHSDIIPAKSLGMKTILVRSKSKEADYCINSIDELPSLLRSITK